MAAGFFTPLLGTALFYYRITHVLFSVTKSGDVSAQRARARRWMAVKRKNLMMSTAVCVCMLVCWTPYSVVAMWETYGDAAALPMEMEAASALLAKSSTALTPLVHLWFAKKFRRWLRVFICYSCTEMRHVEPEDLEQSSLMLKPRLSTNDIDRPRLFSKRLLRVNSVASGVFHKRTFLTFVDIVVNEPVVANSV
ncbi:hypothetical protein RvY_04876 [Ramazzottius varieornatus]|uniref:G-protein coupled receptors family 1 profile domain-containing protein n=1 Tax=Ramazzottius varieornatus TaxID=947166 RepID=A0A1D1UT67_RAMVA|nr:hypothetical protein RvY_04876 [Ramazzottius varieornatus]